MTGREIADRIVTLIHMRCVEEVAPLIFENSDNRELIDEMVNATGEVREWLFLGSAYGSVMDKEFFGVDVLPVDLSDRIEDARWKCSDGILT